MRRVAAHAKINLALVAGGIRPDGKHEVATVLERVELADEVAIEPLPDGELAVEGFPDDTLVGAALAALRLEAAEKVGWRARIEKRIPVAAGLGGGSSDAAAALRLANGLLSEPLGDPELRAIAARLGADVPFFLADGPQLCTGDGSVLTALSLPLDYAVLLVLPAGLHKESTAAVYRRFDERRGGVAFDTRRARLLAALEDVETSPDLASLPRNDLGSSPLAETLEGLGAFRADVSGAGPAVYALFESAHDAEHAAGELRRAGAIDEVWLTRPLDARGEERA
jgi:4-diphosphocytidyl-2-C-methyl-D-erythritol kinase